MFGNKAKQLRKGVSRIRKFFKKLGITLKAKFDGHSCHLSGHISYLKQDGALLSLVYNADRSDLDIGVVFDPVEPTAQALWLLNHYNDNSIYWRGYIDSEDKYLNFDCDIPFVRVKDLPRVLRYVMDFLADEDTKKDFLALCHLQVH